MKIKMFLSVVVGALTMGLGMSAYGVEVKADTEAVMAEAKAKMLEGDRESAALIYYRALKNSDPDPKIRQALAKLLIEAQANEPESDHSDLLKAIEDDERTASLS